VEYSRRVMQYNTKTPVGASNSLSVSTHCSQSVAYLTRLFLQ